MNDLTIFTPPVSSQPGNKQIWGGLKGSALGLALAGGVRAFPGLSLVLTENSQQAERLHNELEFFLAKTANDQEFPILEFPDWETLPYDNFSPHQDIISQRLETLNLLPDMQQGVLILSVSTLMHRLPPQSYMAGNSLQLKTGQLFAINDMRRQLESAGYQCVASVYEHGEFAVRGSIMDIYPMGSTMPYRIELFDDEIESLRLFDPETQISSDKVSQIDLLPGREFPLNNTGIENFRREFRERFTVDVRNCPVYEDISKGLASAGIEYYLPLFYPELETLFDYLPSRVQVFTAGDAVLGAEQFWREINSRYEDRRIDPQRPIVAPAELFIAVNELFASLKNFAVTSLDTKTMPTGSGVFNLQTAEFPDLSIAQKEAEPLAKLQQFLSRSANTPVLICCDSAGRRETMLELLQRIHLHPHQVSGWQEFVTGQASLAITVAPLEQGMWLTSPELIVLTENLIFTHYVSQTRQRGKFEDQTDFIVKSLTELSMGSAVVHLDHGIGRYQGLESFEIEGQRTEFLVLEYADQAKLYVPVSSLHLISRYGGSDPENAPLHKLGSDQWLKARKKAAEKIIDVAAELLEVYARRAALKGYQFTLPDVDYQVFANSFPFEETEDQHEAIKAVITDMTSEQPMDRLVCGDVGFGKTEVALRAAFIAVSNNRQVAVLVPTTLLAQQHYESFRDRFADWPVNIVLMSRFVSTAQQNENLANMANGKADIVIGTHKLLQPDIKYQNLGLLIIDEEHRFGVRQKEKLKAMRANVDILTLTATPIPRTLNMAMSEMRDLSIIASPPPRRLSIKTFVRESNQALIKEAIHRELLRGGQVFYLHNEVKSIEKTAQDLRDLIPEARVCVGHGQLRESELEKVMSDFYHKRHNVLVCSTIIETGIDIPSANTIIIERADTFGLAQLHQLRGRVGRSHHQAYAYLLTPHPKSMSADAVKRLDAISTADTLGAGFTLASHDLEIRGAGELLGDEQSGHMQTIGFTLYNEMLEQTVKAMKEGRHVDLDKPFSSGPEVNLRIPALIPESYLPDVHSRLLMYKRIANARNENELRELKVEMIDRFGLLEDEINLLFGITSLKLMAEQLGLSRVEANAVTGKLVFAQNTSVEPLTLVKLVQAQPGNFALAGANEMKFRHECAEPAARLEFIENLLKQIA